MVKMAIKERTNIVLSNKEASIFAKSDFKPFHNRIKETQNKHNPFSKLKDEKHRN